MLLTYTKMEENPFAGFDPYNQYPPKELDRLRDWLLRNVNPAEKSRQLDMSYFLPKEFKPYGTHRSYPQDWQAYNQVKQAEGSLAKSILSELLDYSAFSERRQGKGRMPLPLRDKVFYMVTQAYYSKSSRISIDQISDCQKSKFVQHKPHFNTLLNCLKDPQLTVYLKHLVNISGIPIKEIEKDFAVDASGFSTLQYDRWFDVRLGKESDKRRFVKLHICVGTRTNIITGVEITAGSSHDSPQFPSLIEQTSKNFKIETVSADKAYSSRHNLSIVAEGGATPYIPFRTGTGGRPQGNWIWRKMYDLYKNNLDQFRLKYHLRSNSETNFHMLKAKFGTKLRTKNIISQTNELLAKCLAHNLCVLAQEAAELGIDIDFKKCQEIRVNQ